MGAAWARHAMCESALSDNIQHSQETDIHAPGRIRTHNISKRAAADPRLKTARPLGRKRNTATLFPEGSSDNNVIKVSVYVRSVLVTCNLLCHNFNTLSVMCS